MKKSFLIATIIAIITLFSVVPIVLADDPPSPPAPWSVVDVQSSEEWITNKAGTSDATPEAKNTTDVTVTVQNNGVPELIGSWARVINPEGKVEGIDFDPNLDIMLVNQDTGEKVVLRGGQTDFEYTLKAGDEEGYVDIVAKYAGKEHILGQVKVFGKWYTIANTWTCWDQFSSNLCNVFGVDSTAPIAVVTIKNHSNSGTEYGNAHYWQTANIAYIDVLSGVVSVAEEVSPDGKTITWTIIDKAGNITKQSVELRESWGFASIPICQKCWHSFVGIGDLSGTGLFHVFAAGGWIYHDKCPYCGYSNENEMRENFKYFVAHGGYVPTGDFYKGANYKP